MAPPQQDWFSQNAPKKDAAPAQGDWFDSNAPKTAIHHTAPETVYTWRNPKEFLQQDSARLAETAQELQNKATPGMYRQGKYVGERPALERAGNAVMSGVAETGSVVEKMAGSMLDWPTAVATAGLSNPVTAPLSAAYFATQGVKGGSEAVSDIQKRGLTPENAQDLALSGATVAGSVAGGGEYKTPLKTIRDLRAKVQPFARKVTGVEPAVKEAVGKAAEQHGEAVTANKAKRAEVIKENLETQRNARMKIEQDKIRVQEANKGIESENKAKEGTASRRGELAKTVDEQSNQLKTHLDKVEQSVAKEANAKFDKVREKIGNPEAPADDLVATVQNVEANILQNIPENIKEFRAILKMEPLPENIADAVRTHLGFEPEGPEPMTWDKLQSLKSRLDARLRSRGAMNGDLKRALYQTRDAVVDEMGKMADANGAQGEWKDARDFWRQYKQDFHEPSGPSGSGSPVAQALDAVDPKNIRQPFLSKQATTGNRAVDILRKYPQHGGTEAATHAESLIKNHQTMSQLPESKPTALKRSPEAINLPANKPLPPRPEAPTVDISKVAKNAIAQRAKSWGQFNARDIGIIASSFIAEPLAKLLGLGGGGGSVLPVAVGAYEGGKFAASRALNNPRVIEWLSKTPPEEAAALAKIPGADKVKIVDGLTQAAVQSGKPVNLSPAARTLLGPANVAKIIAAGAGGQVKNRRDALERLGQPTQ